MSQLLSGKKAIIFGVANKRSIAWSIAQSLSREGAELALAYQTERLADNVKELAGTLPKALTFQCDAMKENEVDDLVGQIDSAWGGLDFVIHSIAYAKSEDLEGNFVKTAKDGFDMALGVSAYSLVFIVQKFAPFMEKNGGGSVVTLTYLGGERVAPGYNVMGVAKAALESSVRYLAYDLGPKNIRVNAVSAGPINTLAARGIKGLSNFMTNAREKSPLHRDTDPAEVGDTALFLCSQLSRGITGQTIYVDCGYSILAV